MVLRGTEASRTASYFLEYSSLLYMAIGVFSRFLPLAAASNARIVLVNRRDYPDSTPLDEKDLQLLSSTESNPDEAAANVQAYMKNRARELYDFLVDFVAEEDIHVNSLVLAAWSFSSAWILALLAHVSTFPVNDVELDKYIRRVVLYGLYRPCSDLFSLLESLTMIFTMPFHTSPAIPYPGVRLSS